MGAKGIKPPETDDLPTEEMDFSQAREAVPVQWFRGTRRVSLQWLTDAEDVRSKQAPDERPSKK